jgi:hypothetical protein
VDELVSRLKKGTYFWEGMCMYNQQFPLSVVVFLIWKIGFTRQLVDAHCTMDLAGKASWVAGLSKCGPMYYSLPSI